MTASKPTEKASRKRRGLLGTLISLGLNIFLISVLVWFLLVVGFGIYRFSHPANTTYGYIQAIVQPNLDFLQQSRIFQIGDHRAWRELRKITQQSISNPGVVFLNHKLEEVKQQWSQMKNPIQRHWLKLKNEIIPLIFGVSCIVLIRLLALFLDVPLFLLFLSLAFVDGLVQRDIRKFQGARESTLLFHELKRSGTFWFYMPLFIYLLLPFPMSPQWFLAPLAIALGVLMQLSTKTFKKYV